MFYSLFRIAQLAITIASAVHNVMLMRYGDPDFHLIVSAIVTAGYLLYNLIVILPPLILTFLEIGCFANSVVALVFLYKKYLWLFEYYGSDGRLRAAFGLNTTMTATFLFSMLMVLYNVTYKMLRYPESEYYSEFIHCGGRRELETGGLCLRKLKSDLVEVKEVV